MPKEFENLLDSHWLQEQERKLNKKIEWELESLKSGQQSGDDTAANIQKAFKSFVGDLKKDLLTLSSILLGVAQKNVYEDMGIPAYQIIAVMDSHTCKICIGMNERIFKTKNYAIGTTAPPFHFFCRCGTVPIIDDEGAGKTGTVWDYIKGTQPNYNGTQIPKSFEINVGNQKVWVHGNATEHIYQDVIKSGGNTNLYSQQLMSDFQGALQKATQNGIKYNEIMTVGNWEFKFAPAREAGQLPALIHSQFNGWGD